MLFYAFLPDDRRCWCLMLVSVPSHLGQLFNSTSVFCDVLGKVQFGIVLNSAPRRADEQRSEGISSDILNLCNGFTNIAKWIKGQRIRWLGHLQKMEEDRMPKKIFTQDMEGTRRRGRPRKRWKEEVERDLQVLGVRRWRELVADRKKWKDIVRQAKAHSGL